MAAIIITAYLILAALALVACKLGWDDGWLEYGQPVAVSARHRADMVRMVAAAVREQRLLESRQHPR